MNYKKVSSAIRKLADDLLADRDLSKNIILVKGNAFHVFGRYVIKPVNKQWIIMSDRVARNDLIFQTSKIALAWCILYNADRRETANELERLDLKIAAKQANIDLYLLQIENSEYSEEAKFVFRTRLAEDINSRQIYKKQIQKCLQTAKGLTLTKYKHDR